MQSIAHPESVGSELLALLEKLMSMKGLSSYSLAGGTSLALRFGHRTSIDIDLFTSDVFDSLDLHSGLAEEISGLRLINRTKGSLCVISSDVKIDFLHHPFPLLEPIETIGGIRLLSLPDVAAMKINAVTNRGSKKDFIDLLTLSDQGIGLNRSIDYFCEKYNGNKFLAVRSLLWFEDAEGEPDPKMLNGLRWTTVKERLLPLLDSLSE